MMTGRLAWYRNEALLTTSNLLQALIHTDTHTSTCETCYGQSSKNSPSTDIKSLSMNMGGALHVTVVKR